ncbi:hypothetical protein H2199_004068 [Coniosporium tulheliwenetii]|uniref:Uncharacterized protein n=1 Tax=Coniosporium tulheliwenetii TaxID=3383036 RepID=A0ACC2Z7V5_9PEZI|nr:hypothetical protein H2199_004068 [Cladosporium sp. JES 115]
MSSISFGKILPKPASSNDPQSQRARNDGRGDTPDPRDTSNPDEPGHAGDPTLRRGRGRNSGRADDDGRGDTPAPAERSRHNEPIASRNSASTVFGRDGLSKLRYDIGPWLLVSDYCPVPVQRFIPRQRAYPKYREDEELRRKILLREYVKHAKAEVERDVLEEEEQMNWLITEGIAILIDDPPPYEEAAPAPNDNLVVPQLIITPPTPRPARTTLFGLPGLEEQPPAEEVTADSGEDSGGTSPTSSIFLPNRPVWSPPSRPVEAYQAGVRYHLPGQSLPLHIIPERYEPVDAAEKLYRSRRRFRREERGHPELKRFPDPQPYKGAPKVYTAFWPSNYELNVLYQHEGQVPDFRGPNDGRVQLRLFETKLFNIQVRLAPAKRNHDKLVRRVVKAYKFAMLNGYPTRIWDVLDWQATNSTGEMVRRNARELRHEWSATAAWLRKPIEDAELVLDRLIGIADTYADFEDYRNLADRARFQYMVWMDRLTLQALAATDGRYTGDRPDVSCRIWDCYNPGMCRDVHSQVLALEIFTGYAPSMYHHNNLREIQDDPRLGPSGLDIYRHTLNYTQGECIDTLRFIASRTARSPQAAHIFPQVGGSAWQPSLAIENGTSLEADISGPQADHPARRRRKVREVKPTSQSDESEEATELALPPLNRKDSFEDTDEEDESPPVLRGSFKNARVVYE